VSFAGVAIPIDNEIICLFKPDGAWLREAEADLKRGDELRVKCGALEGLRGISIAKLGAQPGR
jgi:hypothetical protein